MYFHDCRKSYFVTSGQRLIVLWYHLKLNKYGNNLLSFINFPPYILELQGIKLFGRFSGQLLGQWKNAVIKVSTVVSEKCSSKSHILCTYYLA